MDSKDNSQQLTGSLINYSERMEGTVIVPGSPSDNKGTTHGSLSSNFGTTAKEEKPTYLYTKSQPNDFNH